jgi:hypothetical protein
MATHEQMLRAEHVLGERPRPFETDEQYLERARAALASEPKMGLAEIGGEVQLVPQAGETLTVLASPGEHVWDGVEEKAHAAWIMRRRRSS